MDLQRPLCVFDLETTGLSITNDRIVEMCVIRRGADGVESTHVWRVNPGIPIPDEVSAIHGITDADVLDCPSFKAIAHEVKAVIAGCDMAGYNCHKFDIPFLAEECLRADLTIDFHKVHVVDVQNIFHKKEQRTLSAAVKFYTGKAMENAHNAEADVRATLDVLLAQINHYDDLPEGIEGLATYSTRHKAADFAGFITFDESGVEQFSFGKYRGQRVVDVLADNPGYFSWMLNADFPIYTKNILTAIRLKNR